jgi:hypothetical protein
MDLNAPVEETISGMLQALRNPEWQAQSKVWKPVSAAYHYGGQ